MKKVTKSVVTSAMAVSLLSQNLVGVLANVVDDVVKVENEEVVEKDITVVSNELVNETNELLNGEVIDDVVNVNTIKKGVKAVVALEVEKKVEAARVLVNSGKSLTEMKEAIAVAKNAIADANSKLGEVQLDFDSARNQVASSKSKIMLLEVDILELVSTINEMIKREGSIPKAAKKMKVDATTLRRKLEKYNSKGE